MHCGTICFFHLDEITFIISWFYLDINGSPFYRPNWVTHFRLSYLFMTTLSSSLNHSSLYRASVSIYSMDDLKHFISLSMYRASSVSFTLLQRSRAFIGLWKHLSLCQYNMQLLQRSSITLSQSLSRAFIVHPLCLYHLVSGKTIARRLGGGGIHNKQSIE